MQMLRQIQLNATENKVNKKNLSPKQKSINNKSSYT